MPCGVIVHWPRKGRLLQVGVIICRSLATVIGKLPVILPSSPGRSSVNLHYISSKNYSILSLL